MRKAESRRVAVVLRVLAEVLEAGVAIAGALRRGRVDFVRDTPSTASMERDRL